MRIEATFCKVYEPFQAIVTKLEKAAKGSRKNKFAAFGPENQENPASGASKM